MKTLHSEASRTGSKIVYTFGHPRATNAWKFACLTREAAKRLGLKIKVDVEYMQTEAGEVYDALVFVTKGAA